MQNIPRGSVKRLDEFPGHLKKIAHTRFMATLHDILSPLIFHDIKDAVLGLQQLRKPLLCKISKSTEIRFCFQTVERLYGSDRQWIFQVVKLYVTTVPVW